MDVRWLAGFFDGEGQIAKFYGTVSITQKDITVLEDIQREYGGKFIKTGPKRDAWYLSFSTAEQLRFLKDILPYLRIKNERAIRRIKYLEACKEIGVLGRNYGKNGPRIRDYQF